MTRNEELNLVKILIKENIENALCGLYSTRNLVCDLMETLHQGENFKLDICLNWCYFELFGTTDEEFESVLDYYKSLGGAK